MPGRERHEFCPPLLFATVAEPRALSFLALLEEELGDERELVACVCGLAREPARAVATPVWQPLGGAEVIGLVEALREARRPTTRSAPASMSFSGAIGPSASVCATIPLRCRRTFAASVAGCPGASRNP